MSQIEDSYDSREVSESQPPVLDEDQGWYRWRCDHCGAYGVVRVVWNSHGPKVEFKWLCARCEALTRW